AEAVRSIAGAAFQYRASMLISRLFFRGIYFPQMSRGAWLRLVYDNRAAVAGLLREALSKWRAARKKVSAVASEARVS
ncbi:MAG TPA: hypothetical protein VK422_21905, partial [Pyrinomonadaceae bacterium]|nr:hypothetical protein [Pyrinomonadaceae bacterium]